MARFEFLGRFARNRGALVGACLILLVALVAVLAPLVFPTDPLRIVGTARAVAGRGSRLSRSAPIRSAATSSP